MGFAHRDIRPENILLTDRYILKLADFGSTGPLAGRDGKSGTLKTQRGTPGFIAPEIL